VCQTIGDHQYLVTDLVVLLDLDLRVVLRVFFQEFDLESIDAAVFVHVGKVGFHPVRQGYTYRGCNWPRIR